MKSKENNSEINKKRVVEVGYDKVVDQYAKLEGTQEWPRIKWLKKALTMLEANGTVLDLGCGSGDPAAIEIAKQHLVTGVDISEEQIKLACQKVPDGTFIHHDVSTVQFPKDSFNVVVSFYTLEHIPRNEHQSILDNIHQWLKDEGLLLFSIEAADIEDQVGEWLGVPMFFSIFPPDKMKQMVLDAGFEIIETAVEVQIENKTEIPYLWVLAKKAEIQA